MRRRPATEDISKKFNFKMGDTRNKKRLQSIMADPERFDADPDPIFTLMRSDPGPNFP